MKETLRENIEEYKKADDFESAMKCDIKRTQLSLFLKQLDEALENY